ncbi:MAG TPA: zf-HC2 domain-containing protein [Gemmatimonadetes bacterium]|nr:zf-HC2 domain-containing protein [Gemmatimonadota bacterium]
MTCSEYFKNFSDLIDGNTAEEDVRAFEEHLNECSACSRHRRVIEQGSALLRTLPKPKLSDNFVPRLRHRLYHVDDQYSLRSAASVVTPPALLAMAVILMIVSWLPVFRDATPEIALETVVVEHPPLQVIRQPSVMSPSSSGFVVYPFADVSERALSDFRQELWNEAHALLFEYSPLSQRSRQRGVLRRAGLGQQR